MTTVKGVDKMAKQGSKGRQRGNGFIYKPPSRDGYYLNICVDGVRKRIAMRDENGKTVSTLREAQKLQPVIADKVRKQLAAAGDDKISIDNLKAAYLEHLPNYVKRRGSRHVEASKSTPIAPATLDLHCNMIDTLVAWLNTNKKKIKFIHQIAGNDASKFMGEFRTKGGKKNTELKESTYNRYLMVYRHVFDVIPATRRNNPFREVEQRSKTEVEEDASQKQRFETDQLVTMQKRATGWIRPAMYVGYFSGMRLSDVITLRWSEVDSEGYIQRIIRKTGKTETIYAPEILPELAKWKAESGGEDQEYIFPEQARTYLGIDRKADRTIASKQFQRFLTKVCEFNTKDDRDKTVLGFHSLRVTNATYSKLSGEDIEKTRKRLGHSDKQTTEGYIRETDNEIRRELAMQHRPLMFPTKAGQDVSKLDEKFQIAQRLQAATDEQITAIAAIMDDPKQLSAPEAGQGDSDATKKLTDIRAVLADKKRLTATEKQILSILNGNETDT